MLLQLFYKYVHHKYIRCWILDKMIMLVKQNRSTEGCSKLKSPETRQVQERLVSTLDHMQIPKWDRNRCPEE